MRVLICGGGAVGASIAAFLARRGVETLVVEAGAPACAASGRSGGFLARDWCDGGPLQALARRSFDLHARLANEAAEDWGYRRLDTYAAVGSADAAAAGLEWLAPEIALTGRLGGTETTAQVDPRAFTLAMLAAAEAAGGGLRIGRVEDLLRAPDGARATGAVVDGEPVEADAVVIALGPWSILASRWAPLPGVFGLKGHSVILRPSAPIPPEALFLEMRDAQGADSPELFPRADGTVYVCAVSSRSALPVDPLDAAPDPGAIERLKAFCARIAPGLAEAEVVAEQACWRPVTQDGLPVIGAVPGLAGGYVATGHSVWGILNAPATGEAMAELICDGASVLDLSAFAPDRLPPFDPARLSGF